MCHIPIGILGQVWYLIVSIPDLCTFTYFKNAKINFFEEKKDFECSCLLSCSVGGNKRSTQLEKHQTIKILLRVDFLRIFKNIAFFETFSDF